eukprot:COSAG02_NODE_803_length_17021_cov_18.597270_2_plen_164_part_00
MSTFHWFLSARNLSLNFFGADCAQVFNFPSCMPKRAQYARFSGEVVLLESDLLRASGGRAGDAGRADDAVGDGIGPACRMRGGAARPDSYRASEPGWEMGCCGGLGGWQPPMAAWRNKPNHLLAIPARARGCQPAARLEALGRMRRNCHALAMLAGARVPPPA